MPDTSLIETLKNKLPKGGSLVSAALSAVFLAGSWLIQYGGKNQHIVDVQAQQEKRITDLESEVKNDLATRRELQDFKSDSESRLDRIEKKLDTELSYHHRL